MLSRISKVSERSGCQEYFLIFIFSAAAGFFIVSFTFQPSPSRECLLQFRRQSISVECIREMIQSSESFRFNSGVFPVLGIGSCALYLMSRRIYRYVKRQSGPSS